MQDNYDYINPSHYQKGGKEVIDMMEDIWGPEKLIAHCEMCAFKYRMRVGDDPNQPVERDLEKARWYENKAQELRVKNEYVAKKMTSEEFNKEFPLKLEEASLFPMGKIRNHLKEVINDPPEYICGYHRHHDKAYYSVVMGKDPSIFVGSGITGSGEPWFDLMAAMVKVFPGIKFIKEGP